MEKYFNFKNLNTNFKQEILGGTAAFAGMAYIIILIPKIMENIGFEAGASLTALCLMTFLASLFMGFFAKVPFATAPYLGESAFIVWTLAESMKIEPNKALGVIFVCGVILLLSTIFNVRPKLVNAIPKSLKFAFTIGLGMFLIYTGFEATEFIKIENNMPSINNILNLHTLIALLSLLIIFVLTIKKNKCAILIGIIVATILGLLFGDITLPKNIISTIPSISPIFMKLDIKSILSVEFLPVIFIMLVVIFADTMGTTITLASKANLLDKDGNFPNIKRVMLVDSISTTIAPIMGTATVGTYAEGAVGIEAGAKSGLAPIITGCLFLSALFFAPLIGIIPPYAYGSALIAIGFPMISLIKELDFDDISEYLPALFAILVMVLTKNLGIGMIFGFILHPILKVTKDGFKTLNIANTALFVISILFLIFYPY